MNIVWILLCVGLAAWYLDARQKRKAKRASAPQPPRWKETTKEDPETGDRIIRFECPNPATADLGLIQEFLDHELFMPKIERYLELAKEMNAPAAVIEAIEEKIRSDREFRQRVIEREMEELDRRIEREVRQELRRNRK